MDGVGLGYSFSGARIMLLNVRTTFPNSTIADLENNLDVDFLALYYSTDWHCLTDIITDKYCCLLLDVAEGVCSNLHKRVDLLENIQPDNAVEENRRGVLEIHCWSVGRDEQDEIEAVEPVWGELHWKSSDQNFASPIDLRLNRISSPWFYSRFPFFRQN